MIVTCIAGAHDEILISGFKIAIAHIDSFLVHLIGIRVVRHSQLDCIFISLGGKVPHGRCGKVIVTPCIGQTAGGRSFSCEDFSQTVETILTRCAQQQTGIHLKILQEGHFERVRRIDDHYNTIEYAFLPQTANLTHHLLLCFVQFQIVERSIVDVAILTTHAGKNDDCCIGVIREGSQNLLGVVCPRRFVLLGSRGCVHRILSHFAVGDFVVKIPQLRIDDKAFLLQRLFQCIGITRVHLTGTRAAQHGIDR